MTWSPDRLAAGFETQSVAGSRPGEPGTLVRRRGGPNVSPRAVMLWLHGFSDYFFQTHVADHLAEHGIGFHALDLHGHGRSLRAGQTPNQWRSPDEFDTEISRAVDLISADTDLPVVVAGHSTGGLIAAAWAARTKPVRLAGLVLDSPFLAPPVPALAERIPRLLAGLLGRARPDAVVPRGGERAYGRTIHAGADGEWDYDLSVKPHGGFPIRAGWLGSVLRSQRYLEAVGLSDTPVLLLRSSHHAATATGFTGGDLVLDPEAMSRAASAMFVWLDTVVIENGYHDVFLSPEPGRRAALEATSRWLDTLLAS